MTTLILLAALLRHDGIVVGEGPHFHPLAAVPVTAHVAAPPSLDEACRGPASAVARASTTSAGVFSLRIDASLPRYFALYCANGFVPRGEWTLNERGAAAGPSPVRLWPAGPDGTAASARRALTAVLDYAAAELHDIQRMDATAHLVAKEGAAREDVRAIELLDARAVTADVSRPPRDRASPAAVRAVLDNAASHARYFWRAAPALFTDAARLLTADEQSVLLWLRNRARGASSP